ncbi:hypothetical protein MBANPS3_004399 [Mucor bainieri]
MSFGRPPNIESSPGKAPLRGECKTFMKDYVKCLKENKNNNGLCRQFSEAYLQCRMDNGLMDKDDMGNLGFADLHKSKPERASSSTAKEET